MILKRRLILWVTCAVFSSAAFAQRTQIYEHEDANFQLGLELLEKEKYSAAQRYFQKAIEDHPDQHSLVREDAEFYAAVCGVELFNRDGQQMMRQFIEDHPESPKVRRAYFFLGKHNYRRKKYQAVIDWFAQVDPYDLHGEELNEYRFKKGYSHFVLNDYDAAKKEFYELKGLASIYTTPAIYYYSYIAYTEGNYETALQGFLKIKDDEAFGEIIPYYVSQIYYLQKRYEQVIDYAAPLLDSANTQRTPEINRIIGESYYHLQKYQDALPYLRKYEDLVGALSREDNYQLGYAHYRAEEIGTAIKYFKKVLPQAEDSLTQNALYHLGDCYVKVNQKQFARSSFDMASKMNQDKHIKESALFNYAKLCYELSFNPYSEAINAFQRYITLYPNSIRIDEAYEYLVNAYLTTKNYAGALKSLESIKELSEAFKPSYQKIAYYSGIDEFNNLNFDSAITLLDKSLKYKRDRALTALAYYWKGEAHYRKGTYNNAIEQYRLFKVQSGAFKLAEFNDANYNTGYAYFKQKDYTAANIAFRRFVGEQGEKDEERLCDAFIRIGDCYFMKRDYSAASSNYGKAIGLAVRDMDYALYQRALTFGLQRKHQEKVKDLEQVLAEFPNSPYAAATKYELGETYFKHLNQSEKALGYYKAVVDNHPNSNYKTKSLLQLGLAYYNKKETEKAYGAFDQVVKNDSKSDAAKDALGYLENIYMEDKEDPEGWVAYLGGMGISVSSGKLDSAQFSIAHNRFLEGSCEKALVKFGEYLEKYPEGIFVVDAHYYIGECQFSKPDYPAALAAYNKVVEQSGNRNKYLEKSLLRAAHMNYKQGATELALNQFKRLDEIAEVPRNKMHANVGLMRTTYELKNYNAAMQYANNVLSTEKVENEMANEAHLILGRSAFALEMYDLALNEFQITEELDRSEKSAEASYYIAYIQFLQAQFKVAETSIFDFINKEEATPYWVGKSLILLGDIYAILGDNFQAKHTLKTVIDNSDIEELVKLAQDKHDRIVESEKIEEAQPAFDEIIIDYSNVKMIQAEPSEAEAEPSSGEPTEGEKEEPVQEEKTSEDKNKETKPEGEDE